MGHTTLQKATHQAIERNSQWCGIPPVKRSGRPLTYSKRELLTHIKYLWKQMEEVSALRMKAALPEWLPSYQPCPSHLKLQLERMSASTLKRYLNETRLTSTPFKGLSTISPARYMKNKVPINTLDSKVS